MLFVGTKKQARDGVKEIAEAAGMPYVNHRWLGGLLTNFQTINLRIKRLHDLERYESEGQLQLLPTRERLAAEADLEKLRANLGGVRDMQRVARRDVRRGPQDRGDRGARGAAPADPDHRPRRHQLRPGRHRLRVIPGNDDAIRSCTLVTRAIGDVISEGRARFRAEEEAARREAEEQARREAEERQRREEEARRAEEERAAAEAALTQAGEGAPRDVAEAEVAAAAQVAGGRAAAEGRAAEEATAAAQAADEPAAPAAGSPGPPQRERQNPNAGERVPQGAGAPAAEGAPASDTTQTRGDPGPVSTPISAAQVKELRDRTGAGMMDCKSALTETEGDMDGRVRDPAGPLGNKALKVGGREATEGTVQSYIHSDGKVGVLVEVDCNTDFVARNDDFVGFAREVALHIAASPTDAVRQRGGGPGGRQAGRAARLRAAGRRPARARAPEDRRGQAQGVAGGGRAAQPEARQHRQVRRQDDRAAARSS